jgi:hypothetical protein
MQLAALDHHQILVGSDLLQRFLGFSAGFAAEEDDLGFALGRFDRLRVEGVTGGDRGDLLRAPQEGGDLVSERLLDCTFASVSPSGSTKTTLPLARKVATSSNPIASKWPISSGLLTRRLPRLIPRRKAT